ncbi:MAG: hypothetical protein GY804_09700 [Alphaproteobacteria bacterium]|nr:hypothetical protein [Alphaproteobacteria bacterium]
MIDAIIIILSYLVLAAAIWHIRGKIEQSRMPKLYEDKKRMIDELAEMKGELLKMEYKLNDEKDKNKTAFKSGVKEGAERAFVGLSQELIKDHETGVHYEKIHKKKVEEISQEE